MGGWAVQVLVELELPHLYHSVARNSPKRPLLTEKWGSFQVCFSKPEVRVVRVPCASAVSAYIPQGQVYPSARQGLV